MVETDGARVVGIDVKPEATTLRDTWGIAVWTPRFTRFLHDYVGAAAEDFRRGGRPEIFVGDVVQAAIDAGISVEGIRVSEEPYLDVGTAESLRDAMELNRGEGWL